MSEDIIRSIHVCIDEHPIVRLEQPAGDTPAGVLRVPLPRFPTPVKVTGLPALSVPCGFTQAGLPAGLQIVGPPGAEAMVLRVGDAYERAAGWAGRRPPV